MWEFRKKVLRTFDSNKKGQGTTDQNRLVSDQFGPIWTDQFADRAVRGTLKKEEEERCNRLYQK